MKTKGVAGLIILAILAGLLISCSLETPKDGEEEKIPFDAAVYEDQSMEYFKEHPVNEGEPVSLTMWVNEDWAESYEYLLKEYKQYRPNVSINLITYPWKTYWVKLRLALQNGTGPEIFHMHNGFLMELAAYLSALPEEMFGEEAMNRSFQGTGSVSINNQNYCVNLGSSTGGIFYNKETWRKAGLTEEDIPKTWEELREIAIQLTQNDAAGNITVDGFNFNGETQSLLHAMQAQKGIPCFLEGGQSNLCTPENIENAEFLRKLCLEDKVCRVYEAPARELFGRGEAAMIYGWSWVANILELNYPDIEYGFFCMPAWTEETPPAYDYNNFETSFSINGAIEKEKEKVAQDLLLFYLCNDKALIQMARQAQIVPSKQSLVQSEREELGQVISIQASYIDRTAFKGVVPDAVYTYLGPLLNTDMLEADTNIHNLLEIADKECTRILQACQFQSVLPEYPFYDEFQE